MKKISKEDIKRFWNEYKETIVLTGTGLALSVFAYTALHNSDKPENDNTVLIDEPFDPGRLLNMQFVDKENGEVLYETECYESYMNDIKDIC